VKRSEIYREAARLLESGSPGIYGWSCYAISLAEGLPFRVTDVVREYTETFSPFSGRRLRTVSARYRAHTWGTQWDRSERHDCRVLALCFMAAIAEDEERSSRRQGKRSDNASTK
jgi:hypothetical protein